MAIQLNSKCYSSQGIYVHVDRPKKWDTLLYVVCTLYCILGGKFANCKKRDAENPLNFLFLLILFVPYIVSFICFIKVGRFFRVSFNLTEKAAALRAFSLISFQFR